MGFKETGNRILLEPYEERNRMERLFRKLKERTKRFYYNINTNTIKSIEEIAAIALLHNIITQNSQGGVILT